MMITSASGLKSAVWLLPYSSKLLLVLTKPAIDWIGLTEKIPRVDRVKVKKWDAVRVLEVLRISSPDEEELLLSPVGERCTFLLIPWGQYMAIRGENQKLKDGCALMGIWDQNIVLHSSPRHFSVFQLTIALFPLDNLIWPVSLVCPVSFWEQHIGEFRTFRSPSCYLPNFISSQNLKLAWDLSLLRLYSGSSLHSARSPGTSIDSIASQRLRLPIPWITSSLPKPSQTGIPSQKTFCL